MKKPPPIEATLAALARASAPKNVFEQLSKDLAASRAETRKRQEERDKALRKAIQNFARSYNK
jgi:hypothetical protein